MKRSTHRALILAGVVTLGFSAAAQAQLLMYDGFNYQVPNGTSVLGLNGGTGFAGPYGTSSNGTVQDNLTYSTVISAGKGGGYTGSGQLLNREWGTAPGVALADGSVYWYSMLVQMGSGRSRGTIVPFGKPGDLQNGFGIRIDDDNGGATNTATSRVVRAYTPNQNNATPANVFLAAGTTYLIVGKLTINQFGDIGTNVGVGATTNQIWVNPDPAQSTDTPTGALGTATTTSGWVGVSDTARTVLTGRSFTSNSALRFDEVRVGLNFADVIPTYSTTLYIASAGGSWNEPNNWGRPLNATPVPNGVDATATLGGYILNNSTVFTDSNITLGTLNFDSASTYNVTGTGSLTLQTSAGNASISVLQGSHKINLETTVASSTDVTVAATGVLKISNPVTLSSGVTLTKEGDGSLVFQSTIGATGPATIKINTGGPVSFDAGNNNPNLTIDIDPATVNMGANQTLGALLMTLGGNTLNVGTTSTGVNLPALVQANTLTVTGGLGGPDTINTPLTSNTVAVTGAVTLATGASLTKTGSGAIIAGSISGAGAALAVQQGTVVLSSGNVASVLGDLDIASGASVDLTNNTLVVQGGDLSALRASVASWLSGGSGLSSSLATVGGLTTLAVFSNDAGSVPFYSTFGSVTDLTSADVIVRYTYKGDTNLDGTLDGNDLVAILEGFSTGQTGWQWGDIDYNGVVDQVDVAAFLNAFNANPPALGLPGGSGNGSGAIPEPSTLGLALASAAFGLRRRR